MIKAVLVLMGLTLVQAEQPLATPERETGAAIAGRVVSASGRPVAKATVLVEGEPELSTDEEGRFLLSGLEGRVATFTVSAPGYLPRDVTVRTSRGKQARQVDLVLHEELQLSGIVRGPDAKPLEGAEVRVIPEWSLYPLDPQLTKAEREAIEEREVESDSEGRFALTGLPVRASWRVALSREGFAPTSVRVDGEAAAKPVQVRLGKGASVVLRAVDDEGLPWPAAVVRWFSDDAKDLDLVPEPDPGDEDGVLRLAQLPPGRYSLELRAPGSRPRSLRGVVLREAQVGELGEVILKPGVAVAGVVEDETGLLVEDATVRLTGWAETRQIKLEETTDSEGRFRFEGLEPEGEATVRVNAEGLLSSYDKVATGTVDMLITLGRPGVVTARVLDASTLEPVDAFRADARGESSTGASRHGSARGKDGELRLELGEGTHVLRIETSHHQPWSREDLHVDAGEEVELGEILLEPGWVLEGRVVDGDGTAVAGAVATARLSSGHRRQGRSTSDGRFVIEGLAGSVALAVRHDEYREAHLDSVEPSAGEVVVHLSPGAAVEGLVLSAGGDPIAGAQVKVAGAAGRGASSPRSAIADASGWYRLAGLEPGSVRLTKVDRPPGVHGYEQAVLELIVGQTTRHDFGSGQRVVGVVRSRGEPQAAVRLGLMSVALVEPGTSHSAAYASVRGLEASTNEAGEYAFAGVEPGLHGLTIVWRDQQVTRRVEVTAAIPELVVDVDLPEDHFEGIVLDAETGEPVARAHISIYPKLPARTDGLQPMSMSQSQSGDDGPDFVLRGSPGAQSNTGPDGRFRVPVLEDTTHSAHVWSSKYESWQQEALSLEDLVEYHEIRLERAKEDAKVVVTAVDEQGQAATQLSVSFLMDGSTMLSTMNATTSQDVSPGAETTVIVGGAGVAPAREVLGKLEPGEQRDVRLVLSSGGSLRILAPPGSITLGSGFFGGIDGLQLDDDSEFDWLGRAGWAFTPNARAVEEGEWLLAHLPVGTWTATLGAEDTGPSKRVEIVSGEEVLVDFR